MKNTVQEVGFDVMVTVASGLALFAYMLGVFLEPLPAVTLGGILVIVGTVLLVPREAWLSASILGVSAVILAGALIPRLVVEFATINDEMLITVGLSGVVLFVTFVALHYLAFQPRRPRTA